MREFESGATRSNDKDKLDFEGFLSPFVLTRYAQYLHEHRIQEDGKLRASDNWKKGIPRSEYMKSLLRHVVDMWKSHQKAKNLSPRSYVLIPADDKFAIAEALKSFGSSKELQDSICASIFNLMGYLHELLEGR